MNLFVPGMLGTGVPDGCVRHGQGQRIAPAPRFWLGCCPAARDRAVHGVSRRRDACVHDTLYHCSRGHAAPDFVCWKSRDENASDAVRREYLSVTVAVAVTVARHWLPSARRHGRACGFPRIRRRHTRAGTLGRPAVCTCRCPAAGRVCQLFWRRSHRLSPGRPASVGPELSLCAGTPAGRKSRIPDLCGVCAPRTVGPWHEGSRRTTP